MKEFYRFSACLCLLFLLSFSSAQAQVQTQTARPNVTIDQYCNGYYESLPVDYSTTTKNYPLLVFLHGEGEIGDGSAAELPLVLAHGPPMQLSQGAFPSQFTVGGNTYSFIVISPQLNTWPEPQDEPTAINDIISFCIAHYRVDTTKICLTGLSMGGGIAWDYAGYTGADYTKRLAALLPVAGASSPSIYRAEQMVKFHLPVWATQNQNDPTVPSYYTTEYVYYLDSLGADPAPLMTIFPVSGHDAWDETYGSLTENGLSVYQWMLQYERIGDNVVLSGASQPLPLKLLQYSARLASGPSVVVDWTTAQETGTNYFLVERSPDGQQFQVIDTVAATGQDGSGASYSATDPHPLTGNNFYRLTEVDKSGAATYFSILEVTVPATPSASSLVISPNPASSMINLSLSNAEEGPLHVSLTDMKGNVLQTWLFQKESPDWYQQVPLGNLPAGNYCIHVVGNTIRETQLFLKL